MAYINNKNYGGEKGGGGNIPQTAIDPYISYFLGNPDWEYPVDALPGHSQGGINPAHLFATKADAPSYMLGGKNAANTANSPDAGPSVQDYIFAALAARASEGYRPGSRIQGAPTSTSRVWTIGPAANYAAPIQATAAAYDMLPYKENGPAHSLNTFVEKPLFWWEK